MPRIPTVSQLGDRPTPSGIRPILSNETAGITSKAAANLGATVTDTVDTIHQSNAELQKAYAASAIMKAQTDTETEFADDQNYMTYGQRYTEKMAKAKSDALSQIQDSKTRELFGVQADQAIMQGQSRVNQLARTKEKDYNRATLDDLSATNLSTFLTAPDDQTRLSVIQTTRAAIEAARNRGYVTAEEAADKIRKFDETAATAKFNQLPPTDRLAMLQGHAVKTMVPEVPASEGIDSDYLQRTAMLESSNNPNASNGSSSGLHGFMPETAKQYGLTNPTDPAASSAATLALAKDNRAVLAKNIGRNPTAAELYLAHQQGATGASQLLSQPDANVVDALAIAYKGDRNKAQQAVLQNGGTVNMKASDFVGMWQKKYDAAAPPKGNQLTDFLPPEKVQDLREGAVRDLQSSIALQKATEKKSLDDARSMAYDELEKNGYNPERLPDNVKQVLKSDPERKAWDEVTKYGGTTDPLAKQELDLMPVDDLLNADLSQYQFKLSRQDYTDLQKRQTDLRTPTGKVMGDKIDDMVSYAFRTELGLKDVKSNGKADPIVTAKMQTFKNQLQLSLTAAKDQNGGQWPDQNAIQKISDNLLLRMTKNNNGFLGTGLFASGRDLPNTVTDVTKIPNDDRAKIEQGLRQLNKPVTDATVLNGYRLLQEARAARSAPPVATTDAIPALPPRALPVPPMGHLPSIMNQNGNQ